MSVVVAFAFEELLPFLLPVLLFFGGLVGYGVLVLVTRWLNDR